jgi:orotate phosphoribosyltransferase
MQRELQRLFTGRKVHFRLESGHHGDLWLDLALLCLRPAEVRPIAAELTQRIAKQNVEAVCGPLNEGAFVALMVASELNAEFSYAEPLPPQTDALFPVKYRIPPALRGQVRGKRVAIINDVINAGSAVRGTFHDLKECGAEPVAIGALLVLGSSARNFATENSVALESVVALPSALWTPAECPLCATGIPLDNPAA